MSPVVSVLERSADRQGDRAGAVFPAGQPRAGLTSSHTPDANASAATPSGSITIATNVSRRMAATRCLSCWRRTPFIEKCVGLRSRQLHVQHGVYPESISGNQVVDLAVEMTAAGEA